MLRHTLNPALPVLIRPDGAVQVGWDPRRAKLVRPPAGLSAPALADLLRTMQSGVTDAELRTLALGPGLPDTAMSELVASLTEADLVTSARPRIRTASVRIHGRGPLSELLTSGLRCSGARIRHSNLGHAAVTAGTADLVVLTDVLVCEPRLVRNLHEAKVPHLPVHIRDGTGLIGPLVIPGVTSCLRCTVLATAALALNQVHRVIRAIGAGPDARTNEPLPTLDTTLEFDVDAGTTSARRWSRHPRCQC